MSHENLRPVTWMGFPNLLRSVMLSRDVFAFTNCDAFGWQQSGSESASAQVLMCGVRKREGRESGGKRVLRGGAERRGNGRMDAYEGRGAVESFRGRVGATVGAVWVPMGW